MFWLSFQHQRMSPTGKTSACGGAGTSTEASSRFRERHHCSQRLCNFSVPTPTWLKLRQMHCSMGSGGRRIPWRGNEDCSSFQWRGKQWRNMTNLIKQYGKPRDCHYAHGRCSINRKTRDLDSGQQWSIIQVMGYESVDWDPYRAVSIDFEIPTLKSQPKAVTSSPKFELLSHSCDSRGSSGAATLSKCLGNLQSIRQTEKLQVRSDLYRPIRTRTDLFGCHLQSATERCLKRHRKQTQLNPGVQIHLYIHSTGVPYKWFQYKKEMRTWAPVHGDECYYKRWTAWVDIPA